VFQKEETPFLKGWVFQKDKKFCFRRKPLSLPFEGKKGKGLLRKGGEEKRNS